MAVFLPLERLVHEDPTELPALAAKCVELSLEVFALELVLMPTHETTSENDCLVVPLLHGPHPYTAEGEALLGRWGVMAYDVDRKPGAWVSQRAARRSARVWLLVAGLIAIAVSAVGVLVSNRATAVTSAVFIAAAFGLRWHANREMDVAVRWLGGARAEEAVGEELNMLRPDFVVMHDLDRVGPGNVDHVVSGPTGVFMVETKRYRYEDEDLRKARGRAAAIGEQLGVWVTPVICLATREGEPFKHDRVWIVPRSRITKWIKGQRNPAVEFERLARWADRL